jgi:hypothetical protein
MKKKIITYLGMLFIFQSIFNFSLSAQPGNGRDLLRITGQKENIKQQYDPTVIRKLNVVVNFNVLRSADKGTLIIPVFDGKRLNVVIDRSEIPGKGGIVWYGKIANEPGSNVVLSVSGEVLIGNITTQNLKIYQIRFLEKGIHSLREIDQSKFPNEGKSLLPVKRAAGIPLADPCSTDPATEIDVMVVYTAAARTGAGSTDAMEATVYLAVAEANQAYLNSNITQRLRLVHTEEVSYTESGDIYTDLPRLQNGSDGFMDNVPVLRNTYAADVVSLITENGGGFCGLGYFMSTVSSAFSESAYCVVARSCATGYYSFAHELGHNMGADHDCNNAGASGSYSYDRGWFNTTPTSPATPWRTVMAYNTSPSSTRVQYFSNPGVNYPTGGDPMGATCPSDAAHSADNHQVLNNSALTVANFRCSSPSAANVWMKDTWNDTGLEPDPATATEGMWKSPYIWIRNTQDVSLVHQHQHENPEFGSDNWVYVKLHNGFSSSATGNLELYWAEAAAGLSWPADWHLLTSISVSGFAAHSTKITEYLWTSLPGVGHYCMIARWVATSPSDPMTTPETTDINANVRGNNNIVWRNLNIVDLLPDAAGDAGFIVRNVDKERMMTSLIIRPPMNELKNSFLQYGRVFVQFDETLMNAWKLGGNKGTGFSKNEKGLFLISGTGASFDDILLKPGAYGHVKIIFKRLPTTPQRTFVIDAIQMRKNKIPVTVLTNKLNSQVIGAVSYEIHTDKVKQN